MDTPELANYELLDYYFSFFAPKKKMQQRPILEVLKEFLNEIQQYNNEEIESILDFLPKNLTDVKSSLVEVLEVEVLESQPVREGGASRGVKRPVSVSDDSDEDEESVTKSTAKAFVEKRKKLINEESDRDKGINKF